jgi:hypothetical protein
MIRGRRTRRILIGVVALSAALTAYVVAYYKVPVLRCRQGDVRVYQMRCFDKDFEPYLFAPAGLFEALVIRLARQVRPQSRCGEAIVLCTPHVRLQFRAKADPPPTDKLIPWDADILDYVLRRDAEIFGPRAYSERTLADGSKVRSRYSTFELDEAEDFLRDRYRRPYTLHNARRWYEETCDEATRIHLLVLIAASRDPQAALVVGNAVLSSSLDVRVAAVNALDHFFGTTQCAGGGNLESEFFAAFNWLEENGPRLRRDARKGVYY